MNKGYLRPAVWRYLKLDRSIEEAGHELVMMVMCVSRTLAAAARCVLSPSNLTDAQFNILMLLAYQTKQGMTQSDLGRKILVNRANVTGLVDRLERDGLVERASRPGDRRVHLVRITPRGRRALAPAVRDYCRDIRELNKFLPASVKNEMVGGLIRMCEFLRQRYGRKVYA